MNSVSVIIPCYNEEDYIAKCLDSIIEQDLPKKYLEVLVIDGMSQDKTRQIINEYILRYPFVRLLDNKDRIVPTALNVGITQALGDIIIRMDAHCIYPTNYLTSLIENQSKLNADNVGGVCKVLPANNRLKCRSIAIAMSHRFGVGNSLFRVGTKKVTKVDTVPFGCYRREVFNRIGMFDVDLVRNQDDEFNGRLIKNGGSIFLIPDIVIQYYARDTLGKTIRMFYQYGLYKPLVNKKLGFPATKRQFMPLGFVVGLIVGALLSIFVNWAFYFYAIALLFYIAVSLVFSITEAIRTIDYGLLFILPLTFFLIHVGYGWGYLVGIVRFYVLGNDNVSLETNR